MMNSLLRPNRWTRILSVVVVVVAGSLLFVEIMQSRLASPVPFGNAKFVSVVGAATCASLVSTGVGVLVVTGIKLIVVLRKGDVVALRQSAWDHLLASAMVVVGFLGYLFWV